VPVLAHAQEPIVERCGQKGSAPNQQSPALETPPLKKVGFNGRGIGVELLYSEDRADTFGRSPALPRRGSLRFVCVSFDQY
jgi:hypothetical protein